MVKHTQTTRRQHSNNSSHSSHSNTFKQLVEFYFEEVFLQVNRKSTTKAIEWVDQSNLEQVQMKEWHLDLFLASTHSFSSIENSPTFSWLILEEFRATPDNNTFKLPFCKNFVSSI